jgi:hypothetical protein
MRGVAPPLSEEADEDEEPGYETTTTPLMPGPVRLPPPVSRASQPSMSRRSQSVSSFPPPASEPKALSTTNMGPPSPFQPKDSLSDLVAKDAAQSYGCFSFRIFRVLLS